MRAERLPNVTLNSSYGRVSYPSGALPRLDDFRTNWTVGATLQVPILTGGRLRGDELVACAELAQTRLELQRVEELAALDTRSAWAELLAAQATWDASAGTVQQAGRAYQIAEVRYQAGVSTQLELSDARLQLQQADVTRAQAARDLHVARARGTAAGTAARPGHGRHTCELRPEREATVRAELGGSMLQVSAGEGEAVRKGALLGRIESNALEDMQRSASSAVRAAENQLAVAQREAERTAQLVSAGALAARDLDIAKANVTNAEAQLADARSRLVSAQKELGNAVLRAPLTGIVSDRAVNAGDVVTIGTALFTIVDPSSMRLEASVPSEEVGQLRVGVPVQFEVRGYDRRFEGRIERIVPQADPTTRQVPIFVSIPNADGLVAGLYADGRVITEQAFGSVVPTNAVNTSSGTPWVLRVGTGKAEKVTVTLGLRDPRTERVQQNQP